MDEQNTTAEYAILDENKNVIAVDFYTWVEWIDSDENFSKRTIKKTKIECILVSTMFLSINHDFHKTTPTGIWFETMIFDWRIDDYQERYSTKEEALIGHEKACELVKKNFTVDDLIQ